MTVYELLRDMGMGYNLGNTFECHGDYTAPEGTANPKLWMAEKTPVSWGTPRTRMWFFDVIKEKGFNTIRIPITWYNHMDEEGHVDQEWFDHLNPYIDYVVNKLGMYCVINMHHDDRKWLFADTYETDESQQIRYKQAWHDIATFFKGYSEKLIFGSNNETLDSEWRWENTDQVALSGIRALQKDFFDTVRATGGNNATRFLMMPSYAAKERYVKDIVMHDDRCIAEAHIYESTPAANRRKLKMALEPGYPLCIGEFGIDKSSWDNNFTVSKMCYAVTNEIQNNVAPIMWDDYGNMQILKRNTIIDGVHNDDYWNGSGKNHVGMVVESVKLKEKQLYTSTKINKIRKGNTMFVRPVMSPTEYCFFTSDDETIAKVDQYTGEVTAVDYGKTIIRGVGVRGIISKLEIEVVDEVVYFENKTVENSYGEWNVVKFNTIPCQPSEFYKFDVEDGKHIIIKEKDTDDRVIKEYDLKETSVIETSITTTKLYIEIRTVETFEGATPVSKDAELVAPEFVDKSELKELIQHCEYDLERVVSSESGKEVDNLHYWIIPDLMIEYTSILEHAKNVVANEDATRELVKAATNDLQTVYNETIRERQLGLVVDEKAKLLVHNNVGNIEETIICGKWKTPFEIEIDVTLKDKAQTEPVIHVASAENQRISRNGFYIITGNGNNKIRVSAPSAGEKVYQATQLRNIITLRFDFNTETTGSANVTTYINGEELHNKENAGVTNTVGPAAGNNTVYVFNQIPNYGKFNGVYHSIIYREL